MSSNLAALDALLLHSPPCGTKLAPPVYTNRMESRLTDAEAIALTREGDSGAFGVLVARHEGAAFRAAYLVTRNADDAKDVAQEAFVRAHAQLHRFRIEEPFRPWLLRIVTNLALNERRTQGRRLGLLERAGRLLSRDDAPPPEALITTDEESSTVWEAINRLGSDDRLILYLRFFLELSEAEMARVIDKAPGTVKSRLSRASSRLRALIERDYPQLRYADD
jgi:RNA polymerase sigma factor (sigma-70 family)